MVALDQTLALAQVAAMVVAVRVPAQAQEPAAVVARALARVAAVRVPEQALAQAQALAAVVARARVAA